MPNLLPSGSPKLQSPGSPRPQSTPAGPRETTPNTAAGALPHTPADSSHSLIKVLSLLTFGALAMGALLSLVPAAGHDQLWFLLVARRWLAGATLYGPEIFDSNTPAVVWLSAIPILLARHLHLPEIATAKLLVVLLEALVAALCLRIVRRLAPALTLAQLLWLAFSFVVLYGCAPARDLGQRDHLTALLCLPYVLAAAADALTLPVTSSLRVAAGILAVIGVCLKPQQAIVPLTLELCLLLRANLGLNFSSPAIRHQQSATRDRLASLRRPEPWLLLTGCLAFLLAVHHLTPLFFSLTLPTLLSTYWAIGHLTPIELLAQSPQLTALALIAIVAAFQTRRRNTLLHLSLLLLLAGAVASGAYYVQGTGWYYQQLPAIGFFGAALAITLLPLVRPRPLPRWLPLATTALVALAISLTIHFGGLPLTHDATYATADPDPTLFANLPPGTPIAILTTSVEDSMMPIARFDLTWAQRTNNLWTLPALLRQAEPHPGHRLSPARLAALTVQQRRWMLEDLLRWRPVLLLAERCTDPRNPCQNLEGLASLPVLNPDLLTPFLADPALHDLLTRHYRLTRTTPTYNAYTLF